LENNTERGMEASDFAIPQLFTGAASLIRCGAPSGPVVRFQRPQLSTRFFSPPRARANRLRVASLLNTAAIATRIRRLGGTLSAPPEGLKTTLAKATYFRSETVPAVVADRLHFRRHRPPWAAITAPDTRTLPPPHKRKEYWG
jgi:hypothetical protein